MDKRRVEGVLVNFEAIIQHQILYTATNKGLLSCVNFVAVIPKMLHMCAIAHPVKF